MKILSSLVCTPIRARSRTPKRGRVVITSYDMETFISLARTYLDTSPLYKEHRRVNPHGLMDGRLNKYRALVRCCGEYSHIASESELSGEINGKKF